jgi:hypothetical protein
MDITAAGAATLQEKMRAASRFLVPGNCRTGMVQRRVIEGIRGCTSKVHESYIVASMTVGRKGEITPID